MTYTGRTVPNLFTMLNIEARISNEGITNVGLTDSDIAVLKSLLQDGRKSFRQISREIGLSTPTVKARFLKLLNMGIIKSISPILDLNKLSFHGRKKINTAADLSVMVRDGRQLDVSSKKLSALRSLT